MFFSLEPFFKKLKATVELNTPKPLLCFEVAGDGHSIAFLYFHAALIYNICIYSDELLQYQSFCHVGRLKQKACIHRAL